MSDTAPPPEDLDGEDLLGAEYVLGVLDAAGRATAERRLEAEPAFAADVAEWERRLLPLVEEAASVEPPARLWPAIAARLTGGGAAVVPFAPRPRSVPGLGFWRAVAGAAAAVAAACLVALFLPRPAPPPAQGAIAVARLEAPGGGAAFVATLDVSGKRLVVTPVGAPAPAGKSPQLWLMPANAKPAPLGVFMGQTSLVLPAPAGVADGALLGVSLEPMGGSPTGQPTGPVIAQGRLMRL